MTDLEFVNHPMLAAKNKTIAYFRQGLLPMSGNWKMVQDDSFHMNIVEAVEAEVSKSFYLNFLRGLYCHSRYELPRRYELQNGNWVLVGNENWYWPNSTDSFDAMI
jgi:hypothetical protein